MSRALQAVSLALLLTAAYPVLAQQNTLRISSQPGSAQVYLDDAPKGTTSPYEGKLVLEALPAGTYKLRLSAPGYQDWVETITVTEGSNLSVNAKLSLAAYRVGVGVSAPKATYAPDPEYSKPARDAEYQGTVVLFMVVGPDGRAHDIRVQRSLGLGLDEEAIKAVKQWKFVPSRKDGQPVSVQVNVEINFCLFGPCSGGPGPIRLKSIEKALKAGASPKELTAIVERNGVDFTLNQKAEARLRGAGADDQLMAAIAKAKK